MSEFDSIEEELKFMADCSDDRGDSETSLMFVRYLAHIRKLNAELAALKAGQGEAVEVVAHLILGGIFDNREHGDIDYQIEPDVAERLQHRHVITSEDVQLELMTVAQHERIVAAITAPPAFADAVSVPTEWLDMLEELQWQHLDHDDYYHNPAGFYCPICFASQEAGHASQCRIRALLARSESKVKP